ncbi:unnamed protein product, partial [Didymodactylos carnosus]
DNRLYRNVDDVLNYFHPNYKQLTNEEIPLDGLFSNQIDPVTYETYRPIKEYLQKYLHDIHIVRIGKSMENSDD